MRSSKFVFYVLNIYFFSDGFGSTKFLFCLFLSVVNNSLFNSLSQIRLYTTPTEMASPTRAQTVPKVTNQRHSCSFCHSVIFRASLSVVTIFVENYSSEMMPYIHLSISLSICCAFYFSLSLSLVNIIFLPFKARSHCSNSAATSN